MTSYLDQYRSAKQDGYSDEEIMSYLEKNDPEFSSKMQSAIEDGYSPEEILGYFNSKPKKEELGVGDYVSDFATQGAQGIGITGLGTYGDILDALGLQAKDINPAEKEKYNREFDILEKMEKGQIPSYGELLELSSDEPALRFSRIPSSKNIEDIGSQLGLVTEPKTAAGRYGKRIGKIGGSSVAFGSGAIAAPIVAGSVGQTLEEVGAPPWAQAAGEIIAFLKTAPKSKVPVTSKSAEVEEVIQNLRKAGFSEQDITLAKAALEEKGLLKKYASLTPEAENTIQKGIKNSEELFKEEIKKGLPGYSKGGLDYLKEQASNVYQTMDDLASTIRVTNKEPVKKSIQKAIDYLEQFPLLDEQKKFISFLKDGLSKTDKAETADFFTGFYRNLGKAGNWGDPKQKEHLLGLVQNGIKDTFEASGKEGAKFGKYFEKTNEAWKHWKNTEDLMQTLEKAQSVDGMNFKKLSSLLNDPKNHDLAKKVLGQQQLENIKTISEGAQAIESLLKQIPKSDRSALDLKLLLGLKDLILKGDTSTLGAIVGLEGVKRLATDMLINPEKQNILKKIINAAKNNSIQQINSLIRNLF